MTADITLVTAASKAYWPLLELTAPNKLEYCLRHAIQLAARRHDDNVLETKTERLKMILQELESSTAPDWVWFMGADTLITNMTFDARDLLGDFDLLIGLDINGINNDSMFVRNSERAKRFLMRCIQACAACNNDQEATMMEIMRGGLKAKTAPQREFNSFLYNEYSYGAYPEGTWQPGDLVLHVPGLPMARRMELVREYLAKVVR